MTNDSVFEKHFAGTSQLQIKAETKDGRFHDNFEGYYQNGNKRSEGTYHEKKVVGNTIMNKVNSKRKSEKHGRNIHSSINSSF
ncbi:MAG: antitoxin component YwqK of YwqJK toxin-antitoxin module [Bacteroidia bacterium]